MSRSFFVNLSVLLLSGATHAPAAEPAKPPEAAPPTQAPINPLPEPQPYHGLAALARRQAWRPPERFVRDGAYLSERVVYTDGVTGHEVWQMTVDPGVDRVAYYDLPEWNANGSLLMFVSSRGPQRLWVMHADGTGIRPLPIDQTGAASETTGYWSVRDPDIWYRGERDEAGSRVVAVNVRTGHREVVAETQRPDLALFPPHPKEEHFLLARNPRGEGDCEVIVLGRDGSEQVVPIGGRFHRLRFTKADDLSIFFNRDDPRTQWVIMPDGSERRQLPDAGFHPDWMPDGSELTYFDGKSVHAVTPDGRRRIVFQTGSGGHGGPSSDGRYFVADQSQSGLFPMCIVCARTDGSGEVWPVAYHGSSFWAHDTASRCHPDHHSTHPHPSFSPDGTKAVFSSYFDRPFTDLHVVVCRYPDPPRHVTARPRGLQVELRWEPPLRHREIAGYTVLRRTREEEGYRQIHEGLLSEPTFTDELPGAGPAVYFVAAVEHSGLSSPPSAEVTASVDGTFSQPDTRPSEPPALPRDGLHKLAPPAPTRLAARALDPFHVELAWAPSPDPSVQYYNVYNVPTPDAYGTQTTRIGSPGECLLVDWGRPPGSTQHYRVTAVDRFGNESEASTTATVVLPKLEKVNIELTPENGRVDRDVEIPIAGDYAVWTQHLVPDETADREARLRWGDEDAYQWRVYGTFEREVWWPATSNPSSTPQRFALEAGIRRLRLEFDGDEAQLKRVLITNDATRMPHEFAGPPLSGWTAAVETDCLVPQGEVLYQDPFTSLDNWYHEGGGTIALDSPGVMRIQIIGSAMGGVGCHAFCRTDFPDHVALEYDLKVLTPNGLVITFVAMSGLDGEDMITGSLPERRGIFRDYTGEEAKLRSYHVSVSRYNDKGVHSGVSNWRRNPGLHLMAQGPDLCREIQRWYRIRIVKDGKRLQLQVNGELAHEFTDPEDLPTPLPTAGKIGFRAIGSNVTALIRNLRVVKMK